MECTLPLCADFGDPNIKCKEYLNGAPLCADANNRPKKCGVYFNGGVQLVDLNKLRGGGI